MSTYNVTQTNNFPSPQIIQRIQNQIGTTPLQVNTPAIYATTGIFTSITAGNISFTGASISNLTVNALTGAVINAGILNASGLSTLADVSASSLNVSTTGTLGHLVVSGNTVVQSITGTNAYFNNLTASNITYVNEYIVNTTGYHAEYQELVAQNMTGVNVKITNLSVSGPSTLASLGVSGNASITGTLNVAATGTLGHLLVNGNTTVQNIGSQNLTAENASVTSLFLGYGGATNQSLQVLANTTMTGALRVAGYNILNPTDPIGLYVTDGKGLQVSGNIVGWSALNIAGGASVTGALTVYGASTLAQLSATSLNVSTTGTINNATVSNTLTVLPQGSTPSATNTLTLQHQPYGSTGSYIWYIGSNIVGRYDYP